MKAFAQWVTARSARGFLVAAALAVVAVLALPVAAWVPAGLMVLVLLAAGPRAAAIAGIGGALPIAWAFHPVVGLGAAALVAVAVLVPPYLAATVLETSRSLTFAFQAVTIAAGAFVLGLHVVVGDPVETLMPMIEHVRPALAETARALADMGVVRAPEQIWEATARMAWATAAWMTLLHTMLALFAGLAAFAALREPGLFGREFRALQLGRIVAWGAVASLAVGLLTQLLTGRAWQPAEDLLFVLACGFLLQALAVVHGLKHSGAIGGVPVALTYVAVALLPMAVVALGFADTWVRFRERFGRGPGAAQG